MEVLKCNWCCHKMIVESGAEKCPNCKKEGHLSWIDDSIKEIDEEDVSCDLRSFKGSLDDFFYVECKDSSTILATKQGEFFNIIRVNKEGYLSVENLMFMEKEDAAKYIMEAIDLKDETIIVTGKQIGRAHV